MQVVASSDGNYFKMDTVSLLLALVFCNGLVVTNIGVTAADRACEDPQYAFGDIRLRPDPDNPESETRGVVEIYLPSYDGCPVWGTVCDDSGFGGRAAQVVCNQLGYTEEGALSYAEPRDPDSDLPVWLHQVDCTDSSLRHILRCKYSLNTSTCNNNFDIGVQCVAGQETPYYGEVRLCQTHKGLPPSYGLLQLYHQRQEEWGYVSNTPGERLNFGTLEGNAVCRQLGYTNVIPQSIRKVGNINHTDTECGRVKTMETSKIVCNEEYSCLSCCYDPQESICDHCLHQDAILMQCMYDISDVVESGSRQQQVLSAGSQSDCEIENLEQISCSKGSTSGGIGVPTIAAIVLGIVLGVFILACSVGVFVCVWQKCHGNRQTSVKKEDYQKMKDPTGPHNARDPPPNERGGGDENEEM